MPSLRNLVLERCLPWPDCLAPSITLLTLIDSSDLGPCDNFLSIPESCANVEVPMMLNAILKRIIIDALTEFRHACPTGLSTRALRSRRVHRYLRRLKLLISSFLPGAGEWRSVPHHPRLGGQKPRLVYITCHEHVPSASHQSLHCRRHLG